MRDNVIMLGTVPISDTIGCHHGTSPHVALVVLWTAFSSLRGPSLDGSSAGEGGAVFALAVVEKQKEGTPGRRAGARGRGGIEGGNDNRGAHAASGNREERGPEYNRERGRRGAPLTRPHSVRRIGRQSLGVSEN